MDQSMPDRCDLELLLTGNELMSGDTVDSNSAMIAQHFLGSGLPVRRKVTVGDDRVLLAENITAAAARCDVLLINGGLGPTRDDLTAEVIAELLDEPLVQHERAEKHIHEWCARRGLEANAANLKQSWYPRSAQLIENPIGSAMGFSVYLEQSLVIATPGVPSELSAMLPAVEALIATQHTLSGGYTNRLRTFGLGESTAQQLIDRGISDWPEDIELGFRAGLPLLEIKLYSPRGRDDTRLHALIERITALLGDHIIGEGDTTIASALQQVLRAQNLCMTTAESCTGGLIASLLTAEPGASAIFHAGFVAYSNEIKQQLLGVSPAILERDGAVSEAVVSDMLAGALARSGAEVGVAVSGIAGPDGGTPEKPVGTVCIAWGRRDQIRSYQCMVRGQRQFFQHMVAALALDLLRRHLLDLPEFPHYLLRQQRP
jgi:nicotinamide-nucleotide amidase